MNEFILSLVLVLVPVLVLHCFPSTISQCERLIRPTSRDDGILPIKLNVEALLCTKNFFSLTFANNLRLPPRSRCDVGFEFHPNFISFIVM